MMSENKEQALADFQSITGIEDVGECLMHLEASNWNLIDAINTVMPTESQTLPSERMEVPMDIIEGASGSDAFQSSISSRIMNSVLSMPMIHDPLPSRLLNFSVQYKENTVPLEVPETETIASIKTALHVELGVPTCQQELSGFNSSVESRDSNQISDDTVLSSLHLPQSTNLFLRAPDHPNNFSDGSSYRDRLNTSFRLHIIDITNNKEYNLQFSGSKTVLEVKLGLRDITNIPVRFQRWVGWPDSLKDDYTKIAVLDIPVNGLELILSREETARSKKQLVVELTSSESDNEFEDAAECFGVDDEMFASSSTRRIQPLMPEGVTDETSAVSHFDTEFTHRYGALHPTFEGNLAEALQASCHKTAKERRPLAIYLHHDASVLTNVFCTQLLCSETVASYLALNFVTWAWDITFECNKTFLLAVLSQHLGLGAANTVKNLTLNSLPAVIVITKVRSIPEILNVIPGNVGLDDLMTSLVHAVEVFNSEIQSEIWEEGEREAREQVKREQDAAYEASLLADRAKEEAKRQEFEEKKKQSQQELMKQEELEQQRQHEEAIKDAVRKSLAEQLPAEPSATSTQPVSHIRIRLPNGEGLSRSFLASTSLSLLLTYIASEGYPIEEYKVLASWPRIDLTTVDGKKTLEDLKLYPKETLTLEQR